MLDLGLYHSVLANQYVFLLLLLYNRLIKSQLPPSAFITLACIGERLL